MKNVTGKIFEGRFLAIHIEQRRSGMRTKRVASQNPPTPRIPISTEFRDFAFSSTRAKLQTRMLQRRKHEAPNEIQPDNAR